MTSISLDILSFLITKRENLCLHSPEKQDRKRTRIKKEKCIGIHLEMPPFDTPWLQKIGQTNIN